MPSSTVINDALDVADNERNSSSRCFRLTMTAERCAVCFVFHKSHRALASCTVTGRQPSDEKLPLAAILNTTN